MEFLRLTDIILQLTSGKELRESMNSVQWFILVIVKGDTGIRNNRNSAHFSSVASYLLRMKFTHMLVN